MKIEHLIILAAGRGVRMMPLTSLVPKPMVPIWGSTLISNGIKRIKDRTKYLHVTVGYKGALLAEHVVTLGVSSIFNTNGKGNAWWIYNTLLKYVNHPIFVLTCDNLIDIDFELLEKDYFALNSPACVVVPVKPVEGLEGDYIFADNNVVYKLDRQSPSDYYCSGVQILNPQKLNDITKETDNFNNVWEQLINQKELYVSNIVPKRWYAIDTMEQLNGIENTPPWK